jgi:hypothetical protein
MDEKKNGRKKVRRIKPIEREVAEPNEALSK